jgi:hypothetical protein
MSQVVRRKLPALVPGQRRPGNACVVDQNIEQPVRFQKRVGKAVDGTGAAEVERDRFRVPDFCQIGPGFFDIARRP